MSAHVFMDGKWRTTSAVYCFHEGIGFVKLHSIKVFSDGQWRVVEQLSDTKKLVGVTNG